MAKKRIKKKVTKKKPLKKRVTKRVAKKSAKKKRRAVKKSRVPQRAEMPVASETVDQPLPHDDGHNEPIDNLISEITDNEPEHGSVEQSTEETDDFGKGNDTGNLD